MTTITTDLPCAHCDYNLRAQAVDGTCPECGKPVADALANPLHVADPKRVEHLCLGLLFAAMVIFGEMLQEFGGIINSLSVNISGLNFDTWVPRFLVAVVVFLLLSRIALTPVRHAATALFALLVMLWVSGKIPIFNLPYIGLRYVPLLVIAAAVFLIIRPLPGPPGRWVTTLRNVLGIRLLGSLFLPSIVLLVGAQATVGAWLPLILWLIPHVLILVMTLHAADVAQRCQLLPLARFGQRLTHALVGLLMLWILVLGAGAISYNVFNLTFDGLGAHLVFQSPLILLSLAELIVAAYFVTLARRLRV